MSENVALEELTCVYNNLTTLDVSGTTALTYLGCFDNQLNCLDISNNMELSTPLNL